MNIYIVQRGDTLYAIARRFNTTSAALAQLNQLDDPSRLAKGMALLVPSQDNSITGQAMEINICTTTQVSHEALETLLGEATYMCLCTAQVLSDGRIAQIEQCSLPDTAKRAGALPLITVSNFSREREGFSSEDAHSLFTSSAAQDAFIENLLRRVDEGGYGGVCFDFQYIYPFDRENYSRLLHRAGEALHSSGAFIFAAAAPKTEAEENSVLSGGHDYTAMGRCCDRILLLCTDRSGGQRAPQAPSPLYRMQAVLDYAVAHIPAGKILLELSCRGCDWTLFSDIDTAGNPLSVATAANLAAAAGAEVSYDFAACASHFSYKDALGRAHTLWYEDIRSSLAKLNLAETYDLAGISLWCSNCLHRPALRLLQGRTAGEKIL